MKSEDRRRNELQAFLERFDKLPDDAIVPARKAKAIVPLSERTLRYHPKLPRRYVSERLYGFSAGDLRRLMRGGV
jgi:hypothetical protein